MKNNFLNFIEHITIGVLILVVAPLLAYGFLFYAIAAFGFIDKLFK